MPSPPRSAASVGGHKIQVLFAQAYAHQQAKRWAEATQGYQQVIAVAPQHFDAQHLLGVSLLNTQQAALALEALDRAVKLNPHFAEAQLNRGRAQAATGQPQAAIASFEKAFALAPQLADAPFNHGNVLLGLKQAQAAIACYDQALAINPQLIQAHCNKGVALTQLARYDEASTCFANAIAINPQFAPVFGNQADILRKLNRPYEAIAHYNHALDLMPQQANLYINRAQTMMEVQDYAGALSSSERAVELQPNYPTAHWNFSTPLLLTGDYERGLAEYEWRWLDPDSGLIMPHFKEPLWLGKEPLEGKRIFLHAEQGFGDTLQSCRYAKLVAAMGAIVTLGVQKPLLEILQGLEGVHRLVSPEDPVGEQDYHCPTMSLPYALQSTLSHLPAPQRYITCPPSSLEKWKTKLSQLDQHRNQQHPQPLNKPRIGIVWSGSLEHKNDHNRSIPLADFAQALPDGYDYYSLQKEVRDRDQAALNALQTSHNLTHFGEEISHFADTAALCELMDLIITVDTSVAHLAGALGQPVWILIPHTPDWRWLLQRSDSPWYPSAKLYRKTSYDSTWVSALTQVREDLASGQWRQVA